MFVRHPSMHHLKTGVGVQFSRGPNHAVSQDEKSPQQESAWGLGLRHSRLRPRYCGEPVGGAADRAAPASRLSLQASQTPGPAERELWGHKAVCSSASHTLRAPIPPPLGERNRDVSELFWAGQESWNTAVRSRRARTQRLRLQEDPRREFKAHLNARALLPLPGLEVSTARCSGTAPNHTLYRTLIPTLNPIADRLIPDLHPAEAQATDTPIPGAGTWSAPRKGNF